MGKQVLHFFYLLLFDLFCHLCLQNESFYPLSNTNCLVLKITTSFFAVFGYSSKNKYLFLCVNIISWFQILG